MSPTPETYPYQKQDNSDNDTMPELTNAKTMDEEASPKTSPGVTFRSTPTDMPPTSASGRRTPSSGCHSLISGAAPLLEHGDLVLRAISRHQTGLNSFDPLTRMHSVKFEFTKPPKLRDDTLLEPLPFERVSTSLSEVFMTHTATFESGIDLSRFGGHRDTFAILGLRRKQPRDLSLPTSFFKRLLQYIEFETYLAIRLSCRSWSDSLSEVRPPKLPSVYHLPAEILEQIYYHLSPVDFNAARHTCRAWMLASLDTRLLMHMLARGGWINAALADEATLERRPLLAITNEWPLSKRLATECQLRSEWTGNGVAYCTDNQALAVTTEVDFSELSLSFQLLSNANSGASRLFTPSTCGRYLLATIHTMIFVYKLDNKTSSFHHRHSHGLEAVTSVVCPRRILAVSMDTSLGRFAVAALLEGRIGLVCDFAAESDIPLSTWRHSSATHFEISGKDIDVEEPLPNESLAYHNRYGDMVPWDKEEMLFTSSPEQYSVDPTPNGMPIENGPRSILRNLCSAEDPPRSVAICPQRRCVAFGCSAGIELRWTDVLSGQEMSRWFPLAKSSDFLQFIPPRPEGKSNKRLRLAASAAHPSEKARLDATFAPDTGVRERQEDEMVWECMGNLGFQDGTPNPGPFKPSHFHTVPLSDGYRALFTDSISGHVCLGRLSDLGANDADIAKRVILLCSRSDDGSNKGKIPECYSAATELSWGVRIAVGYADGSLWLFSIPIDMFLASHSDGKDWELGWVDEYGTSGYQDTSIHDTGLGTGWLDWPVHLQGIHVADIDQLEDVSVDASHGGVSLWAFSTDGLARKWEMNTSDEREVWKGVVLRDGIVVNAVDEDGDWVMRNAPWVPSWASTPAGYDGAGQGVHPAWNLASRARLDTGPEDTDEGYASDEGEPSHSVERDSVASLEARFGRLRLSDGDVEMGEGHEGYVSARESRAPSTGGYDGNTSAFEDEGYVSACESRVSTPEENDARQYLDSRDSLPSGQDGGDEELVEGAGGPLGVCVPWSGEGGEGCDWRADYGGVDGDGDLDDWDSRGVEVEVL